MKIEGHEDRILVAMPMLIDMGEIPDAYIITFQDGSVLSYDGNTQESSLTGIAGQPDFVQKEIHAHFEESRTIEPGPDITPPYVGLFKNRPTARSDARTDEDYNQPSRSLTTIDIRTMATLILSLLVYQKTGRVMAWNLMGMLSSSSFYFEGYFFDDEIGLDQPRVEVEVRDSHHPIALEPPYGFVIYAGSLTKAEMIHWPVAQASIEPCNEIFSLDPWDVTPGPEGLPVSAYFPNNDDEIDYQPQNDFTGLPMAGKAEQILNDILSSGSLPSRFINERMPEVPRPSSSFNFDPF